MEKQIALMSEKPQINPIKKMKKIVLILSILAIFTGCSTPKKIIVQPQRKTGDLCLKIDPTVKVFGLGFVIGLPVSLNVNIHEPILEVKFFNVEQKVIWSLKARNPEYGGRGMEYGDFNEKEYTQTYPIIGKPTDLEEGKTYTIELTTTSNKYLKSFVFQHATIYLTDRDFDE
ncbi:MAG: hypothetical protein PHG67_05515 [Bacteroidales bacterium]|jgi:hypothetical protein|nr:hypothetical protein [Bacteroidales bacterium]